MLLFIDVDVVPVAVEEAAEPPPSVNDDGLFINPLRLLLDGVTAAPVAAATEVVLPSCPRRLLRLVAKYMMHDEPAIESTDDVEPKPTKIAYCA